MKVLLLNGSPHPNGCTFRALSEVEKTLQQEGIETEIFHIGTEAIRGCMGCGMCRKNKLGRCIFDICDLKDYCNKLFFKINY